MLFGGPGAAGLALTLWYPRSQWSGPSLVLCGIFTLAGVFVAFDAYRCFRGDD